ncbi:MAG: response regulator [Natronospirillum sp.]
MNNAGVLVVDDDAATVRAIMRLLHSQPYASYSASEGAAALSLLEQENIGVILSDQRMPGLSGNDLLRVARSRHPLVTRIILSGYQEAEAAISAVNEAHVYKILFKPWDDDDLLATISKGLELYNLQTRHQDLAQELKDVNQTLMERIDQKNRALHANSRTLMATQSILDALPVGILHIGEDGRIVESNALAAQWISDGHAIAGMKARKILPEGLLDLPLGDGVHCVVGSMPCFAMRTHTASANDVPTHLLTLIPQKITG